MSDGYLIRHRGRQEGPFSLDTLQQRLTDGEIGLWHEVLVDREWMTVQDFLKKNEGQRKQEEAAAQQRAEEDTTRRREEERRRQEEDDRAGMEEELERQREEISKLRVQRQTPPPPPQGQAYGGIPPPAFFHGVAPVRSYTSAAAGWSLAMGIVGLFIPIFALPAIICGHIGHSNIRNSGGELMGEGMCTAGLVMGYLGIGWFIAVLILFQTGMIPPNVFQ